MFLPVCWFFHSFLLLRGFSGTTRGLWRGGNRRAYDHSGTKRNRKVPSSNRIADTEKEGVVDFKKANPTIGYRALCWMMVDRSIAFISPSSVLRILAEEGLNTKWTHPPGEPKKKGFDQPVAVHEQWHTDISYVNYKGTFVYLIAVLDGFSRSILAWDIRTSMT